MAKCITCAGTGLVIEVVTDAGSGQITHQNILCPVCGGAAFTGSPPPSVNEGLIPQKPG